MKEDTKIDLEELRGLSVVRTLATATSDGFVIVRHQSRKKRKETS